MRHLIQRSLLVGLAWGCAPSPRAVPDGPVSGHLVDAATESMAKLSTWRGRGFVRDVKMQVVSSDPEGRFGWYDARTEALVLVTSMPEALVAVTLTHELCHALQDQHLDLGSLGPSAPGIDAERAWLAVVEGECTLAAAELAGLDLAAHHTHSADPAAQDTLFTYMDGARYVSSLRAVAGWPAVDRALRKPPTTTLQVLHPDSADAAVVGPDDLGGGVSAGAEGLRRWLSRTPQGAASQRSLAVAWRGDAWTEDAWTVRLATEEAADQFAALAPAIRALSLPPADDAVVRLDPHTVRLRGP